MSIYNYNGVVLNYCRTLSLDWENERDPTHTDVLWTKYTIRCRGFITSPYFGISVNNGNSAQILRALRSALTTPRRSFTYALSDNTGIQPLINIGAGAAGGAAVDAKLGPDPLPCTVREVTSGTFAVECGMVVRMVECATEVDSDGNVCPPNPVISLRWNQSESFDENWNSHLITSGRLIVRSDLLQSADNFRPLCTPPIVNDYQRTRAKYGLSDDGCTLEFQFEDVERDRLPPMPATKASGQFVVTCPKPGMLRIGQVSVRLEGQVGTSRKDLLIRALAMCYSKLRAERFQSASSPIIWGTFKEDLFNPVVEVSMQANLSPLTAGGFFSRLTRAARPGSLTPQVMNSVGQDTHGLKSNKRGIAPPDRKRLAGLLTAAFSDPCACISSEVDLTANPDAFPGFQGGNPAILNTALSSRP